MMDDALDQHPFMEQALLEDALLGEESSLDDSARAFSPLMVPEEQSNSEQSETREIPKTSPKNSKSMGCGKPGFITCSICNATKYYSHVQRRFGQFSCEPCSKFMKRFLRDPKVYTCVHSGECKIGRPSGEQEPRGVSVSRCKACWLRICLHKFVLDNKSKEVIEKYYAPRFAPNLKAAKAAAGTPTSTGSVPGPLLSRPGNCTELVQAPAADAPPLPGASIRKRRSAPAEPSLSAPSSTVATASSSTCTSVSPSSTPTKLPGGERCTVRRVAARRKDFGRFDFNTTPKRSNKRTKEIYPNQNGQVRRLRRAVLPNLDRESDSDEAYRPALDEEEDEFSHRRVGVYLEPRRSVAEYEEVTTNRCEREARFRADGSLCPEVDAQVVECELADENNGPTEEECGKCSHCVSGRTSNVLVLKESCKYITLPRPKSSLDNSRSNSTSAWEETVPSGLHTVEYYGGARAALSETIVRRAKRETVVEGDPLLWVRHPDVKSEPAFDKNGKKVKKRKNPVGSVKKSGLFKKNVNFFSDYAFLNEILNANSPFL